MQLGMIGLGRMGANMVRRLEKHGHQCVVFDRTPATVDQLAKEGATGSTLASTTSSKSCRNRVPSGSWFRLALSTPRSTN